MYCSQQKSIEKPSSFLRSTA